MAYTHFDPQHPDATTQGGLACFNSILYNENALMNAVTSYTSPGWSSALTYTGDFLTTIVKTNTTGQQLRTTLTWDEVNVRVSSILYEYKPPAPSSWEIMGTQTFTYDSGTGRLTSTSWSL